jgi:hypothetical protein
LIDKASPLLTRTALGTARPSPRHKNPPATHHYFSPVLGEVNAAICIRCRLVILIASNY